MRHILVVAHQTIAGEELAAVVKARMTEEPCEFTLLVPQTPMRDLASNAGGWTVAGTAADLGNPAHIPAKESDPYHLAHNQLETGLGRLRDVGATATGEVGPADPLAGIREITERRQFDEIIISTLPTRLSKWLGQDLPRKVERQTKLPVTVVSAAPAPGV